MSKKQIPLVVLGILSLALFFYNWHYIYAYWELWTFHRGGSDIYYKLYGPGIETDPSLTILLQFVTGFAGVIYAVVAFGCRPSRFASDSRLMRGVYWFFFLFGIFGIPLYYLIDFQLFTQNYVPGPGFGAWGRTLRVKGRLVHARVGAASGWNKGDAPDISSLDEKTRLALAAWWSLDAKKEHASVPAFARLSWQLVSLGAPACLLEKTNLATLDEIRHAQRCFALVSVYSSKPSGPEYMPELFTGDFNLPSKLQGLADVAVESLVDGCFIEDMNADAAALALSRATDPVVRDLLMTIVRDERRHAELSWDIVAWCRQEGGEIVNKALRTALINISPLGGGLYDEATAALVNAADLKALISHGRVPLQDWQPLYTARLELTKKRFNTFFQPELLAVG